MKKKFALLNYFLMIAVLFSILFQSVHSYEHLAKQLSEKNCHHTYNSSKEITHQHHNFDHCFVCNFTLSSFVTSKISQFEFKKINIPSGYTFFKSRAITQFFKGSLFALRAPPSFIV
ncbi:MAG: hypothetical protein PHC28_07470 [Flavobacterium sp.]|uniref:hypothetical protein n=1 Tax=Flavobacterium sp. TaxID=239 RepID=UPI0026347C03|nr:hypothetical protein [Flavobacterium sp.]MDD5150310.1 hypothetical protein [Flavobacterium sp.]